MYMAYLAACAPRRDVLSSSQQHVIVERTHRTERCHARIYDLSCCGDIHARAIIQHVSCMAEAQANAGMPRHYKNYYTGGKWCRYKLSPTIAYNLCFA